MNRGRLVAGNWKMHMTTPEAAAAVESFVKMVSAKPLVDVVVCPPFTALARVHELVKDTPIKLGAQDVFWKEQGAFTGQISARMLADLGVSYCIVGHSETRGRFGKLEIEPDDVRYFSETHSTINSKLKTLLYHSITPILCVGETDDERKGGYTDVVIREQLTGALSGIDASELYTLVVAYEPVWAIGTGKTCDAEEAGRVCRFVRSAFADLYNAGVAEELRVLYGGSVKADNAAELFSQPDVDGGLIGGASLDAKSFLAIALAV